MSSAKGQRTTRARQEPEREIGGATAVQAAPGRPGNSKLKISDFKGKTGRTTSETPNAIFETGHPKLENRNAKSETGNPKREIGNSKVKIGRSELETRSPKREIGISEIETGESKSETRNSKVETRKPNLRNRQSAVDHRQSPGPGTTCEPATRENAGEATVLRGVVRLLPYQRRWVEDDAQLKIVVKARQIGYSFAATLRAVLECVRRKTTWIFLSKGERQSRLLMEKVQEHIHSCGIVARASESEFFEGTLIKQLETRFANGSVIYGLPANPDTARGYSGHVTLDEFAFHADAEKIYAALFPSITRGFGLEVISTPNGQQGKFHELAKVAGLVSLGDLANERFSDCKSPNHSITKLPNGISWSAHWCDIYQAIREGLKIDVNLLRAGCDDEAAWQQEYCCEFVSTAENFIPPELLAACLSAEAGQTPSPALLLPLCAELPKPSVASAPGPFEKVQVSGVGCQVLGKEAETWQLTPSTFFLGVDIGRHHDRTVFWVDEIQVTGDRLQVSGSSSDTLHLTPDTSPLSVARLVKTFTNTPFAAQLEFARELLALRGDDGTPLVRRAAIDATGMGAPLAESLAQEFGPRVEPLVFTAAVKEDLAYRTRRRLESRLSLLPDTPEVRRAFSAIKRLVTATGALRFDAVRSEAGHADEFWAKALADYAAESQPVSRLADGFLADGAPIISPAAFVETEARWGEIL